MSHGAGVVVGKQGRKQVNRLLGEQTLGVWGAERESRRRVSGGSCGPRGEAGLTRYCWQLEGLRLLHCITKSWGIWSSLTWSDFHLSICMPV